MSENKLTDNESDWDEEGRQKIEEKKKRREICRTKEKKTECKMDKMQNAVRRGGERCVA